MKIRLKVKSKFKNNKKSIYLLILLFTFGKSFSQVGVNTIDPKATLDIHIAPDASIPDGIIAPRLTYQQLMVKIDNYQTDQKGAIIYIYDIETNESSNDKVSSVNDEGYYFFDGSKWIPFLQEYTQSNAWRIQGNNNNPTSQNDNIYQEGNVAIGTNSLNATDVKLQINGNEYITGQVQIGEYSDYVASAQLQLSDNDKGILINKVALQGKSIKAPVTDVTEGILVYNTSTIETEGMTPGFYYWNGIEWLMLSPRSTQPSKNNLKNLQVDCASAAGNANSSDKGTVMNFGTIEITENGSYAFTFRLYGAVAGSPTAGKAGFYYLALVVDDVIIDSVELDLIFPDKTTSTSPIVLSSTTSLMGVINAGQKVEFKLTNHTSSPYTWTLQAKPNDGAKAANRTSMLWWKLS